MHHDIFILLNTNKNSKHVFMMSLFLQIYYVTLDIVIYDERLIVCDKIHVISCFVDVV